MLSKSFNKATREWVQLRKKLYLQIKSEVRRQLGSAWAELFSLEKSYQKELSRPWQSVEPEVLNQAIDQSKLILMGDFHALAQSQRGHLRILRSLKSTQKIALCVEFFQFRHQKFLNLYLKNKLNEKEFLKKINWEKNWGFPWEHYKPIVEWAKSNSVPIYGINWGLEKTGLRSIKTRENFSSMCLKKIEQKQSDFKFIIIYGDLHLSKNQLIASLRNHTVFRKSPITRIFQNDEKLYFQSLARGIEGKLELVQYSKFDFCVQSVPPWVKWQSYLFHLENSFDSTLDEIENDIDYTDHVAQLVQFLITELKIKRVNEKASLAIYTANDTHVYEKMQNSLSRADWYVVRRWITEQRSFYVPELQFGYLGRRTVNHTAALAGEYLHAQVSGRKSLYISGRKDFEKQIWIQAMTYLGSKIINHKRKTNSINDLRQSLLKKDTNLNHRKTLVLAIQQKVREIRYITTAVLTPLRSPRLDRGCYIEAARLLGGMLGEKIYFFYRAKLWSRKKINQTLIVPLESEFFKRSYYSTIYKLALLEKTTPIVPEINF